MALGFQDTREQCVPGPASCCQQTAELPLGASCPRPPCSLTTVGVGSGSSVMGSLMNPTLSLVNSKGRAGAWHGQDARWAVRIPSQRARV